MWPTKLASHHRPTKPRRFINFRSGSFRSSSCFMLSTWSTALLLHFRLIPDILVSPARTGANTRSIPDGLPGGEHSGRSDFRLHSGPRALAALGKLAVAAHP